ncbi:hypothetical protein AC579_5369 [Pseudocercospora musae]|uniref:Uncharacterized protein n=1 Tax=Pseudocercospora musae TaxID=113226 RepID=A0A139H3V6_9PEZI|nr:hypothetical protein AC579_5369 [Pseudocercospora musae]
MPNRTAPECIHFRAEYPDTLDAVRSEEGRFDKPTNITPTRKRKRSATLATPPTLIPSPLWLPLPPLLPLCDDTQRERDLRALISKFRAEEKHNLHHFHACSDKTTGPAGDVVCTPPTLNDPQPRKEYTGPPIWMWKHDPLTTKRIRERKLRSHISSWLEDISAESSSGDGRILGSIEQIHRSEEANPSSLV